MAQATVLPIQQDLATKRKIAFGVTAIFVTQFVGFLFINARNIAQPAMIAEFDGMFALRLADCLARPQRLDLHATLRQAFGHLRPTRHSTALHCNIYTGLGLTTQSNSMLFPGGDHVGEHQAFPIIPFCFAAIGDLFEPSERAKWTGLLRFACRRCGTDRPGVGWNSC